MGTSRLQEEASDFIERSAFAAAVPYLHELDRRLRESDEAAALRARETILYYLGLGRLQSADLDGAAQTLADFLTLYPDSIHAPMARLYRADSYYYQANMREARAVYEEMRELGDADRLTVESASTYWEHYADALYVERDWENAMEIFARFRHVVTDAWGVAGLAEKRAKAGSYLLQGAMGLNDYDAAMRALPELSGQTGETRYDLALNLALLRGGDGLYAAGRYGEALYFYELVIRPETLRTFWTKQVTTLESEQARIAGVAWFATRSVELTGELQQARARLGQLGADQTVPETEKEAVPDYTAALNFRIARCYMARGRTHEAYWAFKQLEDAVAAHANGPPQGFAEEALYGRVKMAAATGRDDRVRRLARRYLRTADFGRFIGDVGYELLQAEVRSGGASAVRELAEAFLDRVRLDPDLPDAPKLIYLVGSTLMDTSDDEGLRDGFAPMLTEYPDRGFSDGLHYWLGLADVRAGSFRPALDHFNAILADYSTGGYAEDAQFRLGVCRFGLLEYPKARRQLEGFLADYPGSRLVSEAHALLGDLAAADGRIEAALEAYASAQETGGWLNPPNMGYINHATFQGGVLLADAGRWIEMSEWFEAYLRRWGKDGRAGDALYQLGRAQVALGRDEAMLELWIQSILEFGNDPTDTGPDRMLAEFSEHFEAVRDQSAESVLQDALSIARAEEKTTLQLRLALALERSGVSPSTLPQVTLDNLEQASSAVLLAAAERMQTSDPELALAAVERALARDGSGPFAAEAWRLVAILRTQQAEPLAAIKAWQHLADNFPTSAWAAEARLRAGDLERGRNAFKAAIAAYREVLKVRQWRGGAWAEANYKIGLTHFEAGDFDAAFGFCQRVYVLYGAVEEWAARAYLTSGQALEAMQRPADAIATYRELLSIERLKQQPAATEAAARLKSLEVS